MQFIVTLLNYIMGIHYKFIMGIQVLVIYQWNPWNHKPCADVINTWVLHPSTVSTVMHLIYLLIILYRALST